VHDFCDVNLTVHSLMHKEYKCVGISRFSVIANEIKALDSFFIFTVRNNSVMT
jgi:hypothetical protein